MVNNPRLMPPWSRVSDSWSSTPDSSLHGHHWEGLGRKPTEAGNLATTSHALPPHIPNDMAGLGSVNKFRTKTLGLESHVDALGTQRHRLTQHLVSRAGTETGPLVQRSMSLSRISPSGSIFQSPGELTKFLTDISRWRLLIWVHSGIDDPMPRRSWFPCRQKGACQGSRRRLGGYGQRHGYSRDSAQGWHPSRSAIPTSGLSDPSRRSWHNNYGLKCGRPTVKPEKKAKSQGH